VKRLPQPAAGTITHNEGSGAEEGKGIIKNFLSNEGVLPLSYKVKNF
jgi:hypothetical protein